MARQNLANPSSRMLLHVCSCLFLLASQATADLFGDHATCAEYLLISDSKQPHNVINEDEYLYVVNHFVTNKFPGQVQLRHLPPALADLFRKDIGKGGEIDIMGVRPGQELSLHQDAFLTSVCSKTEAAIDQFMGVPVTADVSGLDIAGANLDGVLQEVNSTTTVGDSSTENATEAFIGNDTFDDDDNIPVLPGDLADPIAEDNDSVGNTTGISNVVEESGPADVGRNTTTGEDGSNNVEESTSQPVLHEGNLNSTQSPVPEEQPFEQIEDDIPVEEEESDQGNSTGMGDDDMAPINDVDSPGDLIDVDDGLDQEQPQETEGGNSTLDNQDNVGATDGSLSNNTSDTEVTSGSNGIGASNATDNGTTEVEEDDFSLFLGNETEPIPVEEPDIPEGNTTVNAGADSPEGPSENTVTVTSGFVVKSGQALSEDDKENLKEAFAHFMVPLAADLGGQSARRVLRGHQRRLALLDENSIDIYGVEEVDCPVTSSVRFLQTENTTTFAGALGPNATSTSPAPVPNGANETCQKVLVRYEVVLEQGEDPEAVLEQFSEATVAAINDGQLQSSIEEVTPDLPITVEASIEAPPPPPETLVSDEPRDATTPPGAQTQIPTNATDADSLNESDGGGGGGMGPIIGGVVAVILICCCGGGAYMYMKKNREPEDGDEGEKHGDEDLEKGDGEDAADKSNEGQTDDEVEEDIAGESVHEDEPRAEQGDNDSEDWKDEYNERDGSANAQAAPKEDDAAVDDPPEVITKEEEADEEDFDDFKSAEDPPSPEHEDDPPSPEHEDEQNVALPDEKPAATGDLEEEEGGHEDEEEGQSDEDEDENDEDGQANEDGVVSENDEAAEDVSDGDDGTEDEDVQDGGELESANQSRSVDSDGADEAFEDEDEDSDEERKDAEA